ncbi:uncharacterized protein LOC135107605 [Scylla paramamosain]|uniref:uncharacterized protein LOC135107605 n=1 Tax=Scylla paramamosain TaxID=85552 RepID=UPI003082916A
MVLLLLSAIIHLTQTTLQTTFILGATRHCCYNSEQLERKPGREMCCHGDGGGGHDTDAGGGVCARWRHAGGQIVLVIGQTGVYMCTSFTIIGGHFTLSDA